jgi:hypothetical protein
MRGNRQRLARKVPSVCGILATLGKCFRLDILQSGFRVPMSPGCNTGAWGMGIETVLLIIVLTFAIGFMLNRLDTRRYRARRRRVPNWRPAPGAIADGTRKRFG